MIPLPCVEQAELARARRASSVTLIETVETLDEQLVIIDEAYSSLVDSEHLTRLFALRCSTLRRKALVLQELEILARECQDA